MVVVRLQRLGTKKAPHHRVVVTDRQRAQRGRILETLGYYDPSKEPVLFRVDEARVAHWVSLGAQVSEALQRLMKRFKQVSVVAVKR